ncbi:MAG TPA: hypothetical protein VM660_05020, partial [Bacillus sp. (in: firmicutes)]|nr:hypothetical protein [Bacillus sp. (in: firmicutes)]
RMISMARTNIGLDITPALIIEYNILITKINTKYAAEVEHVNIKWSSKWISKSIGWYKYINEKIKKEMNADDMARIHEYTGKRCGYITTNQKKFINSLLGREHKTIVLDRIRKFDEQDNEILIVEEDEIKKEAALHYSKQFRKREHKFNNSLPEEWKRIYKPR